MLFLVLQKGDFIITLLLVNFLALDVSLFDGFDFRLELNYFVFLFCLLGLEVSNLFLKSSFAVLSLQLLPHGEGHTALVQGLVGGDGHLDLVAHSEQQKSALGFTQGNLADDLVEALGEELLSDGADSALTGLALHEFLVEHFSEFGHINSGRAGMTDVLDVVFAVFNPLSRGQDGVEDVFLFGFALHGGQGSLPLGSYRRRLSYSFKFELQPTLVAPQTRVKAKTYIQMTS